MENQYWLSIYQHFFNIYKISTLIFWEYQYRQNIDYLYLRNISIFQGVFSESVFSESLLSKSVFSENVFFFNVCLSIVFFAKCTQLACLLSFASEFC